MENNQNFGRFGRLDETENTTIQCKPARSKGLDVWTIGRKGLGNSFAIYLLIKKEFQKTLRIESSKRPIVQSIGRLDDSLDSTKISFVQSSKLK